MPKLHFYYSAMNAFKSANLIASYHNYTERNMKAVIMVPSLCVPSHIVGKELTDPYFTSVKGATKGIVSSRIGLQEDAIALHDTFSPSKWVETLGKEIKTIDCILIDEAQFLTVTQVQEFSVLSIDVPILMYGLRSDVRGEPFHASSYILVLADVIKEIKTICHCGRGATMNLRIEMVDGKKVVINPKAMVEIGGNSMYISVCKEHFYQRKAE